MVYEPDTIVAISTPPGRGGIGIVRLSGAQACAIAEPLLRLQHPLAPAQARFGNLLDPESGAPIDQVVVTFFRAPHSYTAEDVVEIAAHGSPVLLEAAVRACLAGGARLAEPGEFTQRAFLAGRLDLTQAEAVNDLIHASTLQQARVAASQLGGSLARSVAPTKQELVALIVELEAGVDFAEDDVALLAQEEILRRVDAVCTPLETLSRSYSYGRILREGFRLAIVGRPNAGKSSLFNRLLQRDRAIVTPHPGTTRDAVSERYSLDGIPVELIDTAGLRDVPAGPEGEAEAAGVRRTETAMAEAEMMLHVIDATQSGAHPEDARIALSLACRPHLIVLNKSDLLGDSADAPAVGAEAISVSALTGDGIERLQREILRHLAGSSAAGDSALVTNLRQHSAITEAAGALRRAHAAVDHAVPHEFLLLDLYAALHSLDALTGATTPEDILHRIFSGFCIGK